MTDYTPTMERLRADYLRVRSEHFGFTDLYAAEWDRALAAHDAEVRAGVVAEEPEREYGRLIGEVPYQWLLGSHGIQSATHWRTKEVPAGPWVPLQEGADQ